MRIQSFKAGGPVVDPANPGQIIEPERIVIPMQIEPYLSSYVTDWLQLYGSYNVDRATFKGNLCDPAYDGQSCFTAAARVQPTFESPTIRIGQIRPSIGINHDDHTMLIWSDAARPRKPTVPPNYAELGAELAYQPVFWFETELGVFRAKNLSEAVGNEALVDPNAPAVLGRLSLMPRSEEHGITSWLGTSLYVAGEGFHIENYFLGLGLLEWGSLMLEGSRAIRDAEDDTQDEQNTSLMALLTAQIKPWLLVHGRVGTTTTTQYVTGQGEDIAANQYLVGVQFFPVPFVEIRPEYRILDTENYRMGQYTVQLHLFY